MEKTIYQYILRHSLRQQIVLTLMAVASFPFLYAFYELPKEIVNKAIQGKNINYPVELGGMEFEQVDYLFLLTGVFLALVAVNQTFKYIINVYRGRMAERMLRRLRYELYARVLRFPSSTFRKLSSGEIIAMITGEVEPLGGFIGESFSLPVYQGGTLLVILGFLMYQNPYMALAAVAFYPLQFYLIPKMQRKVNAFSKERVRLVRRLSERIGESVAGVPEVHANNAARLELADFALRLGRIYEVRFQIYNWKFLVKFLNNTINQLGPFCFYSIGGYLVIQGQLDVGTLLAAVAAHKDLAAPWKELLTYYEWREDARIKYEQIITQFQPPGLMEPATLVGEPDKVEPLQGEIVASNVTVLDDVGQPVLEGLSFRLPARGRIAVVGAGGSGKEYVGALIARLVFPASGTVQVGGVRLSDLPEAVTGRRIGYAGPSVSLFAGTVRQNLLFALQHRPLTPKGYETREAAYWRRWFAESEAAGNSVDDVNAEWVDYEAAGCDGSAALTRRLVEVLGIVDLGSDVYDFGLRSTVDPAAHPELAAAILEARTTLRARLTEADMISLVEVFDPNHYNNNATVGENLLFGTPVGPDFMMDRLAENEYVLSTLAEAGMSQAFLNAGIAVARTMVELFADIAPGHPFFEQFSFIAADDLPQFQAILTRIDRSGVDSLSAAERTRLLALPFRLVPARHRLDVIDDTLRAGILRARSLFAEKLPEKYRKSVEFFDVDRYNAAATLQENILFGKLVYGQARGPERVGALIAEVIDRLGLREAVIDAGLDFSVGIGGGRLSPVQRQKIAIARAILKRPDILVLNEATAALDAASDARVMDNLFASFDGQVIVWTLHRAAMARKFDHVVVMMRGKIAAQGTFDELAGADGPLTELMGGG